MRLALLAMFFIAQIAHAQHQQCFFVAAPVTKCDGTGVGWAIPIPAHMPVPADITSAYFQHHMGTRFSEHIGGTINVGIGKPTGFVNLVAGLNRHGAVRWTWDPPVRFNVGDSLGVSYGCDVPIGTNPDQHISPDIQICWRVP